MLVSASVLLPACAAPERPAQPQPAPQERQPPPAAQGAADALGVEAEPGEAEPFRAVALISSYDSAADAVSLLFPTALDHAKAEQIVQRMAQLGGWTEIIGLQIEDDRFVSLWEEANQKDPQGQLQTYVEFGAAGVINHGEGWLALDPFIVALKDFSPVRLALTLGEGVVVAGPGDYADNKVQIECNRRSDTIVYDIIVKDPTLTSTGVPAHAPAPREPAPPRVPAGPTPLLAALISALAVTAVAGLALALYWKGLWPWAAKSARGGKRGADAPESNHKSG